MAFTDFSNIQYIKTVDTGEEARMGSFQTANSLELKYMRVTIYINGAPPTNEQVRVNIYSDENYSSLLYSSEWASLNQIPNPGNYWIGWIRTDFDRQPINKFLTYYPSITLNNYTRNAGTYFIGFAYDFPFSIYLNESTFFYDYSLQMAIFGFTERQR